MRAPGIPNLESLTFLRRSHVLSKHQHVSSPAIIFCCCRLSSDICNSTYSLLFSKILKSAKNGWIWFSWSWGKPATALFKDSKALFLSPNNHHPPTIPSPPHSLSPYYSPCHNLLSMPLLLHLCGYIWVTTHSCNVAFLFYSISHFPFSFFLSPPTLVTYFIVLLRGPSWPLLPVLLPTKAALSVVCKYCISCNVSLSVLSIQPQYSYQWQALACVAGEALTSPQSVWQTDQPYRLWYNTWLPLVTTYI